MWRLIFGYDSPQEVIRSWLCHGSGNLVTTRIFHTFHNPLSIYLPVTRKPGYGIYQSYIMEEQGLTEVQKNIKDGINRLLSSYPHNQKRIRNWWPDFAQSVESLLKQAIVKDHPCNNSFMDGKALEALSTPPSLVNNSKSLRGTPRDSLYPDTPYFKSLTYAEKQSADHALRLFPDDLMGDQRQGSGEVFCPPPNLSSVGIERSISPDELDSSDVESSVLDLDNYATMFSPCAEEPTIDQRAGLPQNSTAQDDQLLGSNSDDAPNCVPEKDLCLSQLSSAHDREYAKGTSSPGTNPSLDVNVNSSISELNKIDSPAAEQPWSGNNINSPTADDVIPNKDSAGPSEPPSNQCKPGRSKCQRSKKCNGSGVGS
ncbi:uncharacterized protein P174DRAFT_427841 [Aspergillus novofumigatus IBT 16806]|uniref:Uncharacterized protein n=1 Tax=Aspergillus novofumigatus (strain IBT 16806) TaxID=1392255 RepID=A0A2I1CF73_ASPN1|nr:uncharacterized protein P174DRAFT_427841 [Aspergillus novofumigatus IBT 16806]PKX96272.1 hypothetical protein P174DRAFT_427841 [Aspergillus novofumigatus IBT 16806]